MNYKMVFYILGLVMKTNGYMMLLPLGVSILYGEKSGFAFLAPIVLLLAIGTILSKKQPEKTSIYSKEGLLIVSLSWLSFSIFGAVPFLISGSIPSIVDSFFETVSGFTTTGATILNDIESLPKGILFWRSFTHWIGGMGVLVFALAVLPQTNNRAMHIMKAEVPGPTKQKLVARMKETARILYTIYIILTIGEIGFLLLGKMPLFDSIVTAFSTAGTGGFGIKNTSIAYYNSYYLEMVISIFMLLFGVNFSLFYLLLTKHFAQAFKSEELKWYMLIVAGATAIITWDIYSISHSLSESFRYAFFQVSSIITTTGFITADYTNWPYLSQGIIMVLMMIGASAGSTGGGIKVSRILLLFKSAKRSILKTLHPNWVMPITLDTESVEESVLTGVTGYLAIFTLVYVISFLAVTATGLDLESSFGAIAATINNVGPGLGVVGPISNFSTLHPTAKLILCFDMLAGRLEFFPILALFSASTWRK